MCPPVPVSVRTILGLAKEHVTTSTESLVSPTALSIRVDVSFLGEKLIPMDGALTTVNDGAANSNGYVSSDIWSRAMTAPPFDTKILEPN